MLLSSTNIENYSVKKTKHLFASIRAIGVKREKIDNICKNCLGENMSTPRSVLITGSQRGLCPETHTRPVGLKVGPWTSILTWALVRNANSPHSPNYKIRNSQMGFSNLSFNKSDLQVILKCILMFDNCYCRLTHLTRIFWEQPQESVV